MPLMGINGYGTCYPSLEKKAAACAVESRWGWGVVQWVRVRTVSNDRGPEARPDRGQIPGRLVHGH